MDSIKILLFFSLLTAFFGAGLGYEATTDYGGSGGSPSSSSSPTDDGSSGGDDGDDGDDGSDGSDYEVPEPVSPYEEAPAIPDDLQNAMCGDSNDNDEDGLIPADDPACVEPRWYDTIEGQIWDTHLMAELGGFSYDQSHEETTNSPETWDRGRINPALFHKGHVFRNNQLDSSESDHWKDDSGNGEITTYWVDAVRGVDEHLFGYGFMGSQTFDTGDFQSYEGQQAEITEGRVILPPHNFEGDDVCGNGIEDQGISKIGDRWGNEDFETDCKADYGEIQEIYDIYQPYERPPCEEDTDFDYEVDKDCDSSDASVSTSCNSCSGSSASCTADVDVSCSVTSWDNQEDNHYYRAEDDLIVRYDCEDTGDPYYSGTYSCTVSGSSASSSYSTGPNCYGSSTCSRSGCRDSDDDDCEAGTDERTFDSGNTVRNCNAYNIVHGGGSEGPGNDPAGTFTKFTAHYDEDWGGEDMWVGSNDDGGEEHHDGSVWCGYDRTLTVNADGPQGDGNGFIVIDEDEGSHSNDPRRVVARESPSGSDMVGRNVHYGSDGSADSLYSQDFIDQIDLSCNGNYNICIKYVDFHTVEGSSSHGTQDWTTVPDAVGSTEIYQGSPDESYSVCKAINRINQRNGDNRGDDLIDCDYMQEDENIAPLPQSCGAIDNQHKILMEGPQVEQDVVEEYLLHEQTCVEWNGQTDMFEREIDGNACVNKHFAVAEGTVMNVASTGEDQYFTEEGYEKGTALEDGDSPDWQVCLNIRDSNVDTEYNDKSYNYRHNDKSNEGYGGQWYDLDDERVNEYLRSGDHGIELDPYNQRHVSPRHIDYYYREHPNPQHNTHNPKGGQRGTSLLADCGPRLDGCADDIDNIRGEDVEGLEARDGHFFAFFDDYARDDDFHPQGRDNLNTFNNQYTSVLISVPAVFEGQINMIKSVSDQLSPGHHDFDQVYNNNIGWYQDTRADEEHAVQYAYTEDESWVVDATGVPYPPWGDSESGTYASSDTGIHYREDYSGTERISQTDDTVQKHQKAFGNSLAVVATETITQQDISQSNIPADLEPTEDALGDTTEIEEGEGFWIDPDNVRRHWMEGHIDGTMGASSWKELVTFDMDLTGPDSGLGWDYGEDIYGNDNHNPDNIEFEEGGSIVYTQIHWERDSSGEIKDELQPPMCGDDRREYLIEELGEAPNNPEQYDGHYGCATQRDLCFLSEEEEFYEVGTHIQTNERAETENRLKQDLEYCDTNSRGLGTWYDQDFRQGDSSDEYCRENTLYGSDGKRWFSADYVQEHPHAVTGGIDDSWNDYMAQQNYDRFESRPNAESWDFSTETPVDTGTNFDYTGSLGFCGGDDGGEHLVTQECNTQLCSTNRNVMGVAQGQEYCIFDGSESQYSHAVDEEVEDRRLYEPGSEITFDLNEERTISCFGGTWYDSWPIVFSESDVEIPVGDEKVVEFRVINVENVERTFEVEMFENSDLYTFSSFVEESGSSFRTTVEPQSSERFRIRMNGGREGVEDELTLGAEAVNSGVYGEDSVRAKIVEDPEVEGVSVGEPESVPGIGVTQVMALVVSATLMFFFRS